MEGESSWRPTQEELRAERLDHVVEVMRRFIARAHAGCRAGAACPAPDWPGCDCRDAAVRGLSALLSLDPSLLPVLRAHGRRSGG